MFGMFSVLATVGLLIWGLFWVSRSWLNGYRNHEVQCTVGSSQFQTRSVPKGGSTTVVPVQTRECGVVQFSNDHLSWDELKARQDRLSGASGRRARFLVGDFDAPRDAQDGVRFLGFVEP